QLPKISKNDPAIKELEVKKGDLIKIERKSPTIGKSIFYRVVVGNA
ncbi:MAG: DNA-directed RNA polymerase subunit H, partial [Nanoarchaeota archaeon]|nr:DNA-directed RNA polymerase subunit H [Nanoarchaeota archaeon]